MNVDQDKKVSKQNILSPRESQSTLCKYSNDTVPQKGPRVQTGHPLIPLIPTFGTL